MIPAGAPQAKIKIKAIKNAAADGTRVVKIKLLPDADGSYIWAIRPSPKSGSSPTSK